MITAYQNGNQTVSSIPGNAGYSQLVSYITKAHTVVGRFGNICWQWQASLWAWHAKWSPSTRRRNVQHSKRVKQAPFLNKNAYFNDSWSLYTVLFQDNNVYPYKGTVFRSILWVMGSG